MPLKRKFRQGDSLGIHWRRWSLSSTSSVNIRAVTLTTFPFQWRYYRKRCPGPLHWRHNGHDSVSDHQHHDCLLNRLFRRRSKKISKLRVTGLCAGIHRRPVNSPHKWPVTRKMFPFDDVIMPLHVRIWRLVCQGQLSRARVSNYIPQYLYGVITWPCSRY